MATCSPDALFYPMADTLNVAMVLWRPEFGFRGLRTAGDSQNFAAFAVSYDRPGQRLAISSPGGRTTLAASAGGRATIDWLPEPMDVRILVRPQGVSLTGVEHIALRIEVDRGTGDLQSATALRDTLDLEVSLPSSPDVRPKVHIDREVSIVRANAH